MTSQVSSSRSNGTLSHPSKGSIIDRPNSCSNKSLMHDKSCPVHSRFTSYKTIGQCHDKMEELERQNIRLISKVKVLKYQLKTASVLYTNIHQRPEKPLTRHSQRSTPVKMQKISRLSRVDFEDEPKISTLPDRKFESTESFDSENSLVENKSKLRENIELIHSHRVIKSMEIKIEMLQAQCKAYEQNLIDVNELFQKEKVVHEKLKEEYIKESQKFSELKPKLNAYKETNKALEEQILDLQKEKISLREHNQKLLQLSSKPQSNNNGIKLKELEDNFSDSRISLLKQMEENSKYIAELKGTINVMESRISNYLDENEQLKNQKLETTRELEIKEKKIIEKKNEIEEMRKESLKLKEKLEASLNVLIPNDVKVCSVQNGSDTEDKKLKSQIQDLHQEQTKINQALNSQSYLNTILKEKVEQSECDLKVATQIMKILLNLFINISSLNISEPLITTIEMIEKSVSLMKKHFDVNIENKDFEEVIKRMLEVLIGFRDQMFKTQTSFHQAQRTIKPTVNIVSFPSSESSCTTDPTPNNTAQLEIHIDSLSFTVESLQHLKSIHLEPNVFLTWGFKDQEDVAYSPSRLAWATDFNCSCFYRSTNSAELLHFVTKHGLFVNVHLVSGKDSPVVATGLLNTADSINNPMVKFNLIVPIKGENVDAKLKCSFQLFCDSEDIQKYGTRLYNIDSNN
ncbi:centromere protein F-like [Adelges cooleyi]|uniref:centromere protein F-like n=1 Tax=Adelges cooleyi TaxID=133065 RepID=UPI00217FE507|nr:centromere protein F-like [Adelges cooleyi]